MGKITTYAFGNKNGEGGSGSSAEGEKNTIKSHKEVITSCTNPQNRPHEYADPPRSTMPKLLDSQVTGTRGQVEQAWRWDNHYRPPYKSVENSNMVETIL